MKKTKSFDCVEMKNAIHAQLRKEHEGLEEAEVRRRLRHWLETSGSSVAKWWRSIEAGKQEP